MTGSEALIEVRLTRIEYAARDINLFELRPVGREALPAATAGAHIDIHLPNGLVRQYSLTEASDTPGRYTLGVKRDPASRGGSKALFEAVKVGDILRISAPRNHFALVSAATHTVLIAGGIGITPLRCMVSTLMEQGRSWELHYCARSQLDAAFLEEFRGKLNVHCHFDEEHGGAPADIERIVHQGPPDAHYYCCGPQPMLAAFERAAANLPLDQVHVEYFTAKEFAPATEGFTVEISSTDQTFEIGPNVSILKTLCAAGFNIPFSCEEGTCGACETKVLEGVPDHRDSVLSPLEQAGNKTMMLCVSGAKSPKLKLDI